MASADYKPGDKVAEWRFVDSHQRNVESQATGKIFTSKTMYFDALSLHHSLTRVGDMSSWCKLVRDNADPWLISQIEKTVDLFSVLNALRVMCATQGNSVDTVSS